MSHLQSHRHHLGQRVLLVGGRLAARVTLVNVVPTRASPFRVVVEAIQCMVFRSVYPWN